MGVTNEISDSSVGLEEKKTEPRESPREVSDASVENKTSEEGLVSNKEQIDSEDKHGLAVVCLSLDGER